MKRKLLYFLSIFILFSVCALFYLINQKNTIAIIGAMDDEINEICSSLNKAKTTQINDFTITTGTLGKNNVVVAKSGVGKVASATTAQFIIDNYKPIFIINTGIAGSLSTDLKAGDVVVAQNMVQHDFDVTAFGSPKGYIDNGIEPDKPTIFHSDKILMEKLKNQPDLIKGNNITYITLATGDTFVNQEKQKFEIRKEFKADAVDMESASIAQTAQRNNVPLIVVRTISDSENNSISEYKKNKKTSAQKSALIVKSILD